MQVFSAEFSLRIDAVICNINEFIVSEFASPRELNISPVESLKLFDEKAVLYAGKKIKVALICNG